MKLRETILPHYFSICTNKHSRTQITHSGCGKPGSYTRIYDALCANIAWSEPGSSYSTYHPAAVDRCARWCVALWSAFLSGLLLATTSRAWPRRRVSAHRRRSWPTG